jgi:signal recognition particle subunit SRP14
LTRLTTLLSTTHAQSHGSIYLTQKSLDSSPSQILIRATNGLSKSHRPGNAKVIKSKFASASKDLSKEKPKVKFAAVVDVSDIEAFYVKYAEICKKGMECLRKRDKKKAKARKKGKKGKASSAATTT